MLRAARSAMHLILDFDGTLTTKDTIHLLARTASLHQTSNPNESTFTPWKSIVSAYSTDLSNHTSQYTPTKSNRHTLSEERAWLSSLTPIEERSIARISASEIFRGITTSDLQHVARQSVQDGELKLRDGWADLLPWAASQPTPSPSLPAVSILSVNWSATFIRAALHAAIDAINPLSAPRAEVNDIISKIPIIANDFASLEAPDGSTGLITPSSASSLSAAGLSSLNRRVHTSADKLAHLTHLKMLLPLDEQVVYVGDSATDLECLLAADVGICMRDEPMGGSQGELSETLERIGVGVRGAEEWLSGEGAELLWVRDFRGVMEVLERYKRCENEGH